MPNTQKPEPKPRKEYLSSAASLSVVWEVLHACKGKEPPLTPNDLYKKLKNRIRRPSLDTVRRILPGDKALLEQFFPGILAEKDIPVVRGHYLDGRTLHIVLDSCSAGQLDALLQQGLPLKTAAFPWQLRCVHAQPGEEGELRLIPYDAWEKSIPAQSNSESRHRYYLTDSLTDSEWRIFTDLILICPFISVRQAQNFQEILNQLHKPPKGARPPAVSNVSQQEEQDQSGLEKQNALFERLAILDNAVRNHQKIVVTSAKYVLRQTSSGSWRPELSVKGKDGAVEIEIKPYALMWSNGNYYLVGQGEWGMMNLRVDRLRDIYFPDESETFELPEDFDPMEHRNHCPVMYPGPRTRVRMRCHTRLLSVLIDFFGDVPEYSGPQPDGTTEVTMEIAPAGLKLFAMQYASGVEVLEPPELRREIAQSLHAALEEYSKDRSK